MRKTASDIVAKLWNLCNILKDDGVTYHQYVIELTYLLFLKMAKETGAGDQLPVGFRWEDLLAKATPDRLQFYKILLIHLGDEGSALVKEIFDSATSTIKKPGTLSKLVDEIDKLDWYSVEREDLGDLYEGLLEKNANEKKSGAGQYFTPRMLIDSIVTVTKPTLADAIQDPAAGTGGFLIAANHYLRTHHNIDALTAAQKRKYRDSTFYGMEHVQDTHRLALMNLMLHGIDGGIRYGDTLSPAGQMLPPATLMLSNPPFGSKKGGGLPERDDFNFPTSNKQLAFLQHIYLGLKPGGRAAVVVPDNVLSGSNVGVDIRREMLDLCDLHTILRLPTGIFYAQGVKTSVLFFTRGAKDKGNSKTVWIYDLRTNMPQFGKRIQLTRDHFIAFEQAFGDDPLCGPHARTLRQDTGEVGRFRSFSRDQIAERGDSLDISWLKDDTVVGIRDLPEPAVLAQQAMDELEGAMEELRGLLEELGEDVA